MSHGVTTDIAPFVAHDVSFGDINDGTSPNDLGTILPVIESYMEGELDWQDPNVNYKNPNFNGWQYDNWGNIGKKKKIGGLPMAQRR